MGFTARIASAVPADPPDDGPPGRLPPVAWAAPALLTLAITLVQAGRAQLWRDELATWSAASRPVPDLIRLAGHVDAVSGPYYLFMHGWMTIFGDSAPALRAPSILAMTAAAGLTAALGHRLSGPRTGLLAGLLFAVAPSTSRYAQEARSYALATLLAVLATLLLARALDRPTWRRWVGYGVAVLGLGLAHLMALGLVAGHAAAALLAWRRARDRRMARWFAVSLPVALVLTPLALVGRGQQTEQLGWVGKPSIGEFAAAPAAVLQSGVVGGLLVGLALLGAVTGFRPSRRAADRGGWGLVLGMSVLLPAALLFVGGWLSPLWVPRYLVCTVPLLCLLAAAPLARLRLRLALPIVAVVAFLGAPDQIALRRTHEWPRNAPIDYRAAGRIVEAGQLPGDGIVYAPRTGPKFLDTAIAYQLRDRRPRDVLLARDQVSRGDLWATECGQPARCLAGVNRVWLIVAGRPADPLAGLPPAKKAALRDSFTMSRRWTVSGLTVALLTRDSR